jgi:hypothetical protein
MQADILNFAQKKPETTSRYDYAFEWDNWAAIPIRALMIGGKKDCRKKQERMFVALRNAESL